MKIDSTEIHVWALHLNLPPAALADFASVLDRPEYERAARFCFDRDRNRFVVRRALLRVILGRYLGTHPAKVEFSYGPHGKPAFAGDWSRSDLQFNQTDSGDLSLVAVTRSGPVGIDVEQIRPMADVGQIVARFFSADENTVFQALSEDERQVAFFNLWTRKEAWLKATGEGLAYPMDRVEVSFLPGEPARLVSLMDGLEEVGRWRLHHLAPASGFVGALAARATTGRISCRNWANGGDTSIPD